MMPELPEVESVRRDLQSEVPGRRIKSALVRDIPNAMRVIRRYENRHDFERALAGRTIDRVERRGKYLLLVLDEGLVLVVHLGMSGQMLLSEPLASFAPHTHVVLEFTDGGQLRYVDPRTFGQMFVADRSEVGEIAELNKVGMDPLVAPMSWEGFSEALSRRKTKIKSLLMDQGFIAGIGNIYSDEMLFAAGVRHDRTSDSLSEAEARMLFEAVPAILQAAVAGRGTSMRDEQYRDLYGSVGGFQHQLKVYGREGEPCLRCQTSIQRARWTNRSTHFCPQCQN